ncbi:hypothetical protein GCM10022214_86320 [Actinomadura miaoliensis]|uniref:Uncharacterized protein n=1 Tax=Actinomadura miaoliensis TaxID=430685 RepID=A0ABP7X691_9ACTN
MSTSTLLTKSPRWSVGRRREPSERTEGGAVNGAEHAAPEHRKDFTYSLMTTSGDIAPCDVSIA